MMYGYPWFDTFFVNAVTPSPLAYSSGDTLDYVEPCLPCASVSVETFSIDIRHVGDPLLISLL